MKMYERRAVNQSAHKEKRFCGLEGDRIGHRMAGLQPWRCTRDPPWSPHLVFHATHPIMPGTSSAALSFYRPTCVRDSAAVPSMPLFLRQPVSPRLLLPLRCQCSAPWRRTNQPVDGAEAAYQPRSRYVTQLSMKLHARQTVAPLTPAAPGQRSAVALPYKAPPR